MMGAIACFGSCRAGLSTSPAVEVIRQA